jgi:hypothetical protein
MDQAAAIPLLFSADKDDVIAGLRDWQVALRRNLREQTVPKCARDEAEGDGGSVRGAGGGRTGRHVDTGD